MVCSSQETWCVTWDNGKSLRVVQSNVHSGRFQIIYIVEVCVITVENGYSDLCRFKRNVSNGRPSVSQWCVGNGGTRM